MFDLKTWFFSVQSHVKTALNEAGVVDGYPIWMSLNGWHLCFVCVLIRYNDHDLRTDWEGFWGEILPILSTHAWVEIDWTRWNIKTDVESYQLGKHLNCFLIPICTKSYIGCFVILSVFDNDSQWLSVFMHLCNQADIWKQLLNREYVKNVGMLRISL